MAKAISAHFPESEDEQPHYVSFILRCWTDGQGQIRARLVKVHTGVSYPLTNLNELPALVRRLVMAVPSALPQRD